ncbi:MAG: tRNA pseudouridine(55) synthase TruB [Bryobacterales bacterium]|nr:tRNA pseudouridine(55) synthase TruB [Bryobacterales bacterium]
MIVVDKPAGWTSHDVVNRVRRLMQTKKVGHLGTLDPSATGVLPVVVGRATRLAQFFTRNDKVYEAVIRFGFSTDTYDAEGKPASPEVPVSLSEAEVERHLAAFRGIFQQTPPPVSAKKVAGVPAYKLARKQMPVVLPPVEVEVYELSLLDVDGACARVRAHCSAGTYVRAIAHDLGVQIGCGAHLAALRRTASGDFRIEQAHTLERLAELAGADQIAQAVIPAAELLPDFPSQFVDEATEGRIRQGRDFPVSPFRENRASRYVKAISRGGQLVAIGELKLPNVCHPMLVF